MKERSFLIDIMQIEILILHRVVQELSNNIKTLLPTYSSHLSLNGNRYIFLPFSSLSHLLFFFFSCLGDVSGGVNSRKTASMEDKY